MAHGGYAHAEGEELMEGCDGRAEQRRDAHAVGSEQDGDTLAFHQIEEHGEGLCPAEEGGAFQYGA